MQDFAHRLFQQRSGRLAVSAAAGLAALFCGAGAAASQFNQPGNTLISDQFNNRVIEVDHSGNILWQFGVGPTDVTATSPVGVNDAQRVGSYTLIAGTGVPAGGEPLCPTGCADNRVMLVNEAGKIVWQYGTFGVSGAGPNQLNTPTQNTWTPFQTIFITDQVNERIIEVNLAHQILWQYGTTGVAGNGTDQLNNPNSAELLANGHILIADENNNRAIEVDRQHNIIATFSNGGTVNGVAFASRLPNGDTLLTDTGNARIVEVNANDQTVWEYFTNQAPNSNTTPLPSRAIRLHNGDTIISDQVNDRVIVVNMAKAIVTNFGNINQPGFGTSNTSQGLNWPYDAKVIGDYTGLTPPGR